ncbi:hypothetical protein IWX83_001111 [Flavobacterium sp. CG_9.1]|uniref:hypothetical protein n=1 Tax=Flavobacterium sp. CG_9.1 TaxID=2787728 RepID=UPI0018C90993|nr:hypothetical protein [Flavobacterium sp. CG_9.1]MBG6061330.1 hypothetical protein [Flavobacterium sp. CG_9.1]
MKKILFFPVLFFIFLLNIAGTCCADEVVVTSTVDKIPDAIRSTLNQGTWKITYFFDSKTNKLNSFSGYNFTFGLNDVLTAQSTSLDYSGKWSVIKSNKMDDNPHNDIEFTIAFLNPNGAGISEDWSVFEITPTQLRLRTTESSAGETKYLTFEKS